MKAPFLCFVIALAAAPTGKADVAGRCNERTFERTKGDVGIEKTGIPLNLQDRLVLTYTGDLGRFANSRRRDTSL